MTTNSVRFSRTLYDKHDPITKQVTKEFFRQHDYTIHDDGEHYADFDYQIEKDKQILSVEVEQKTGWNTRFFPFKTMDVAGRKSKSKAHYFVQLNNNADSLHICPMSIVHRSETYRKDTKYSKDELFYKVNLNEVDTYIMFNSKWTYLGSLVQGNTNVPNEPLYPL